MIESWCVIFICSLCITRGLALLGDSESGETELQNALQFLLAVYLQVGELITDVSSILILRMMTIGKGELFSKWWWLVFYIAIVYQISFFLGENKIYSKSFKWTVDFLIQVLLVKEY